MLSPPLAVLFAPVVVPYSRPPALRAVQPLRWASDACARALLKPGPLLGRDLQVRPSPGRGQGLFALRPFDEGEFIVRYTGILCSIEEFNAGFKAGQTSGDYIFLIGDSNLLIDAEDPEQSSAARYINHS
ncbi:MAG: hypothetical protein SGPRY_008155, partial [Prymnesium sp.]